MSEWLQVGTAIPTFCLPDADGRLLQSSQWSGAPLVIYFYPRDDTPGCTREACAFRDAASELRQLGASVVGISADSPISHAKFRDKYGLNFALLSDVDHAVSQSFGAYREKNLYGKKSMGIQRSTFLVASNGTIAKLWKRVQVDGHHDQVIQALKVLPT